VCSTSYTIVFRLCSGDYRNSDRPLRCIYRRKQCFHLFCFFVVFFLLAPARAHEGATQLILIFICYNAVWICEEYGLSISPVHSITEYNMAGGGNEACGRLLRMRSSSPRWVDTIVLLSSSPVIHSLLLWKSEWFSCTLLT